MSVFYMLAVDITVKYHQSACLTLFNLAFQSSFSFPSYGRFKDERQ